MPEKDGSEDKKSTKSVVNKKQKQFMNQEEQLDLSSVAESFGGQIVGEPVELDEIALTATVGGIALWKILAGLAGAGGVYTGGKLINKELEKRAEKKYIDNWAKEVPNNKTNVLSRIQNIFKSKKKEDGETKGEKVKPDIETEPKTKPFKPLKLSLIHI